MVHSVHGAHSNLFKQNTLPKMSLLAAFIIMTKDIQTSLFLTGDYGCELSATVINPTIPLNISTFYDIFFQNQSITF